jgi:hypothetical protein
MIAWVLVAHIAACTACVQRERLARVSYDVEMLDMKMLVVQIAARVKRRLRLHSLQKSYPCTAQCQSNAVELYVSMLQVTRWLDVMAAAERVNSDA